VTEGVGHIELTLESLVKVGEVLVHDPEELVHALGLLEGDHHVRARRSPLDLFGVFHEDDHFELIGEPLEEIVHQVAEAAAAAAPPAAAASAGQDSDGVEHGAGELGEVSDLGVGVHAEEHGRLGRHAVLDVVEVRIVVERGRIGRRELVQEDEATEELRAEEYFQVRLVHAAVEEIGDVAAVHDLAEDVPQVGPLDLVPERGVVSFLVLVIAVGSSSNSWQCVVANGAAAAPPAATPSAPRTPGSGRRSSGSW